MKNLKFYLILGLSALFVLSACNKDDSTEDPGTGTEDPTVEVNDPVLTLDLNENTFTVSGDAGVYSVGYQVENPVDGASVSVDLGGVTWITDATVTDSTIDLTVEANTEGESRTATLTVSYPGAEDVSLTVVQEIKYDYNHDLSVFLGYFFENYGTNGEDYFHIWLANDVGFTDSGITQVGGRYYNLALYVTEADGNSIPTGTYTYSESSGNMVHYRSRYLEEDAEVINPFIYFTEGSITVSADGDTYTIEAVLIDENGAYHRIYYTGPAVLTPA